jgi:hypothetical protein
MMRRVSRVTKFCFAAGLVFSVLTAPARAEDKNMAKASPSKPPVAQPAGKVPATVPGKQQEPVKAKGLKPLTGVL